MILSIERPRCRNSVYDREDYTGVSIPRTKDTIPSSSNTSNDNAGGVEDYDTSLKLQGSRAFQPIVLVLVLIAHMYPLNKTTLLIGRKLVESGKA